MEKRGDFRTSTNVRVLLEAQCYLIMKSEEVTHFHFLLQIYYFSFIFLNLLLTC